MTNTKFEIKGRKEWGHIYGAIDDQSDLSTILNRIESTTTLTSVVDFQETGGFEEVTIVAGVSSVRGFVKGSAVVAIRANDKTFAQFKLIDLDTDLLTLTLLSDNFGLLNQTLFVPGDKIVALADDVVGVYGGVANSISRGIENFGSVFIEEPFPQQITLFTAPTSLKIIEIVGAAVATGELSISIEKNSNTIVSSTTITAGSPINISCSGTLCHHGDKITLTILGVEQETTNFELTLRVVVFTGAEQTN